MLCRHTYRHFTVHPKGSRLCWPHLKANKQACGVHKEQACDCIATRLLPDHP
jgi:hypothetical protein